MGLDVYLEMIKIDPKVRVIFTTGYALLRVEMEKVQEAGNAEFIGKPFTEEELLAKIDTATKKVA